MPKSQISESEKFIKNTIYTIIGISITIFLLIQPYNLFCKIKKSCQPVTFSSFSFKKGQQQITINFTSKINKDLKTTLNFYPQESKIKAQTGQNITTKYIAQNLTNQSIIIRNHFKVNPSQAKQYLEMIQCLCFQNQPINPLSKVLMPIHLRINPKIEKDTSLKNLKELTLTYQPYLIE